MQNDKQIWTQLYTILGINSTIGIDDSESHKQLIVLIVLIVSRLLVILYQKYESFFFIYDAFTDGIKMTSDSDYL